MISSKKRVDLCGFEIDSCSKSELFSLLDSMVEDEGRHFVSFVDANLCFKAATDPAVNEALHHASLVLPDGASIVAATRLTGNRLQERLVGPDIMFQYCQHTVTKKIKHFFYGGAQGVAEQLSAVLIAQIPGLKVVGTWCPPFRQLTREEQRAVNTFIEARGSQIVWVGLGAPKQDMWMYKQLGKLNVPLMIGVGAAFDYLSGERKRAPTWVQNIGFEWLHRMLTQGPRIFYRNLRSLPLFGLIILKQVMLNRLNLKRRK